MLDRLYAGAAGARRRWFERHPYLQRRLERPVLSIGNLSLGGTGKTPLVARVAAWLAARGERPAILSRGYGRTNRRDGVVVVSDGRSVLASLDDAGDEPLMLAREVQGTVVAVAEDRHLAGIVAERALGATVHVLDDGFQHVQLARDLDILLTRPGEAESERVVPFGRLREPMAAAARAHVLVVVGADVATARSEAWTLGVSQAVGATRVLLGTPADQPVVAIAGIADADQFFASLEQAGWSLAGRLAFRDHYRYRSSDIAPMAKALSDAGAAALVTTEKDGVRLSALDPLPFPWSAVPMRLEIDGWEELTKTIDEALVRGRGRQ